MSDGTSVYGDRAHVPSYLIKGGITFRIIADHLGSPRLIVNASDGSVAQRRPVKVLLLPAAVGRTSSTSV
jgi:hypothetical protein